MSYQGLPKHVHGLNMGVGVKKLILNYIGTAITYEKKIYIFLDSREMYFDYTRWVFNSIRNLTPDTISWLL